MPSEDFEVNKTGTRKALCEKDIEIMRLRAALEWIATKPPPDDAYELRALARKALDGE